MGLFLGTISNFNLNKGRITLAINEPIEIGDTISIESEQGTYTVSEIVPMGTGFSGTKFLNQNRKKWKTLFKSISYYW